MEEEIENEKKKVNKHINQKYFGNAEPIIHSRQHQSSIFASTNSFEKLREEILNH